MSSNEQSLDAAVNQSIVELQKASAAVTAGASPEEAFSEIVGTAPMNVVGELQETAKYQKAGPSYFILRYGDRSQRWGISTTGNIIVPVTENIVSGSFAATKYPNEDIREKRKRIDGAAKSVETIKKISELSATVQKAIGMPSSVAPHIGRALTPTEGTQSALALLVQIGTIAWLKKFGKTL